MTDKTGAAAAPRTDLVELRRLEAAATPGPWEVEEYTDTGGWLVNGPEGEIVVDYSMPDPRYPDTYEPDARFIAALRNAAPELLGAAESGASRRNAIDEIARLGQQIENAESGASPAAEDRGLIEMDRNTLMLRSHHKACIDQRHPFHAPCYGYDGAWNVHVLVAGDIAAALPHGEPARTPKPDHGLFQAADGRWHCRCGLPALSEAVRANNEAKVEVAGGVMVVGEPARTAGDPRVNREALAAALYEVSLARDWANTEDTEDRTDEIADAYERRAALSEASSLREPSGEGES